MTVRCANQPLEDTEFHKIIAIFQRLAGPHQKAMIRAMHGPPSDSYFTDEGKTECLTHILLWQAK